MKRIDRYREKLVELENKHNQLARAGKYMKLPEMRLKIEEVRKQVEEMERYEAKPVRELLSGEEITESGLVPMIMECHLAADFLTDCTMNLKDKIKEMGLVPASLIPELDEIIKKADAFASMMCYNKALTDMLTDIRHS